MNTMVSRWYPDGIQMVSRWYPDGANGHDGGHDGANHLQHRSSDLRESDACKRADACKSALLSSCLSCEVSCCSRHQKQSQNRFFSAFLFERKPWEKTFEFLDEFQKKGKSETPANLKFFASGLHETHCLLCTKKKESDQGSRSWVAGDKFPVTVRLGCR